MVKGVAQLLRTAHGKDRLLNAFLPAYAEAVLRGPSEYGGKFILGPHHIEWGKIINRHSRILALAARDHGKSFMFCFAYPIWMIDRKAPGKTGYIFSASEDQACEHLDKIRQEVCGGGEFGEEGNPKLAHLLPLQIDSRKKIRFANGSEIRARGFGARVRGGHPFWTVCDDVGNDEWIWSDATRGKHIDYFLSAIEPMPVPGGQLIVVGTPFHAQDLYNTLEEGGVFHTVRFPAIAPHTGRPLWPKRYNLEALERKRKTLASSLRWSREYLCQPISSEASIFPTSLFEQPGVKQPYDLGDAAFWAAKGITTYMGVDLAMSASAGGDYFVCLVMGVTDEGERFVLDIYREKGLGYQAQVDKIIELGLLWDTQLVFVEANQYQRVITDMVVRTSDIPVKAFYTTGRGGSAAATTRRRGMNQSYVANKNALDQGIPAIRMLLENLRLHFPWLPRSRPLVKRLIDEMQAFGWAEGKMQGVGSHDDMVMALWIADRAADIGGAGFGAIFSSDEGEEAAPVRSEIESIEEAEEEDFFGGGEGDWRPREGVGFW